ncbi:MAG: hypothetical protein EA356_15280 [Geminicoccaceae bacterium]|nr:MAG: hypothetical protein EA356_15280 [Geminicoccaceae bacterium]
MPLMAGMLVLTALFFAVMSVVELRQLYDRVEQRPLDLAPTFLAFEQRAAGDVLGDTTYLRFKTLALLEADALHRRYHQANATMLARVWTRQLGFLTGMILALVGAAFVLGRLQETTSTLEIEARGTKAAIASASPGLVLAALGASLMAVTLVVPFGVETRDLATYLRADAPLPPSIPLSLVDPGSAPPLPLLGD